MYSKIDTFFDHKEPTNMFPRSPKRFVENYGNILKRE